jgi:hypothetical protein
VSDTPRLNVQSNTYCYLSVQRQAVELRKVLHRDSSLNNAMIEDDGDGSHGMLIDWEFAVDIVEGEQYVVGGTVGIMSLFSTS